MSTSRWRRAVTALSVAVIATIAAGAVMTTTARTDRDTPTLGVMIHPHTFTNTGLDPEPVNIPDTLREQFAELSVVASAMAQGRSGPDWWTAAVGPGALLWNVELEVPCVAIRRTIDASDTGCCPGEGCVLIDFLAPTDGTVYRTRYVYQEGGWALIPAEPWPTGFRPLRARTSNR